MDPDDDQPEARVMVLGDAVEGADALFAGPLADAKEYVRALPPGRRAQVAIVTDGRVWDPREI